jgi:FKBP12-rapamycin complex-associated protein
MENREMLKLAPDYDLLTVMQKVEVFEAALHRTIGKGNDLYEVLWMKSSDSEEWLEHRTKYTRSLAVMSIVGYILGLGDRHVSEPVRSYFLFILLRQKQCPNIPWCFPCVAFQLND